MPTSSKAISRIISPPTAFALKIKPCPKVLCSTLSPTAKLTEDAEASALNGVPLKPPREKPPEAFVPESLPE